MSKKTNIAKLILPSPLYNFMRMKPRFMVVSKYMRDKIQYINSAAWRQNPDNRGDSVGAALKSGHIIDKGLQNPGREPGHSLNIAYDLAKIIRNVKESEPRRWTQGILDKHSKLQKGSVEYGPFLFEPQDYFEVIKFEKFLKSRRTLRNFSNSIPDREDIIKILEVTRWAPSSCNRQTIVNFFTLDSNLVDACIKLNPGATSIDGKYAFISICYDTRSYHLPQESFTGLIDASLAFQNSLLMAHAMGLGGCILNWVGGHAENRRLKEVLGIPFFCEIAFNAIIGIPKMGAPVPGKRELSDIIVEKS